MNLYKIKQSLIENLNNSNVGNSSLLTIVYYSLQDTTGPFHKQEAQKQLTSCKFWPVFQFVKKQLLCFVHNSMALLNKVDLIYW